VPFKKLYKANIEQDLTEGYLEVIEMGVVDPKAVVTGSSPARNITAGIKHTKASVPADCSVVADSWVNGPFTEGGATATVAGIDHAKLLPGAILAPTGGLQGWAFLLDANGGNAYVSQPAAIRNYQTAWGQHYRSDNLDTYLLPSLASGNVHQALVANHAGTALNSKIWPDTLDYVQTTIGSYEATLDGGDFPKASGRNPYPIAHVLAATGLTNDYLTVKGTPYTAKTDWVVNFPFRKHGIYAYNRYTTIVSGLPNFQSALLDSDVKYTPTFYNTEEQTVVVNGQDFSPYQPGKPEMLPREVNVLTFGYNINVADALSDDPNLSLKALKSPNAKPISVSYNEGWGSLYFKLANGNTDAGAAAITAGFISGGANGIPALGFAAFAGKYSATSNEVSETVPHAFIRQNP